ncbi:hypothetical protein ACRE85_25095, partial [Klebsiella pneumoniae]|uniref:hypothetical protein n=1 Tax=Klebsiella pneumoniae TaxID=573 RepID=UPI003982E53D
HNPLRGRLTRNLIYSTKPGKALKPIPVNETLLDYLQPQKRLQFIKQWRSAAAK